MTLRFDDYEEKEVKEISYKSELSGTDFHGTSSQRIGSTRGTLKNEASMTLSKEAHVRLINYLGDGFLEKRFTITMTYVEGGVVITDVLEDVRMKTADLKSSSGDDPLEGTIDLDVSRIKFNGKYPLIDMKAE